jgi:hypothetical protein
MGCPEPPLLSMAVGHQVKVGGREVHDRGLVVARFRAEEQGQRVGLACVAEPQRLRLHPVPRKAHQKAALRLFSRALGGWGKVKELLALMGHDRCSRRCEVTFEGLGLHKTEAWRRMNQCPAAHLLTVEIHRQQFERDAWYLSGGGLRRGRCTEPEQQTENCPSNDS